MNRIRKIRILFLGVLLLLYGCVNLNQPSNKVEYYTLEYAFPQMDKEILPDVIRLERFTVAPEYNSNRIIFRDDSFKRDAYTYFRWRANPGDLATHFFYRDIRQSGLFKAVLPYDSRLNSSHIVEGSVDEFFEWDKKESWSAVLSISITLIVENEPNISKRILFQKSYNLKEKCEKKNPAALAQAMSNAMAKVSQSIILDIHKALKSSSQ